MILFLSADLSTAVETRKSKADLNFAILTPAQRSCMRASRLESGRKEGRNYVRRPKEKHQKHSFILAAARFTRCSTSIYRAASRLSDRCKNARKRASELFQLQTSLCTRLYITRSSTGTDPEVPTIHCRPSPPLICGAVFFSALLFYAPFQNILAAVNTRIAKADHSSSVTFFFYLLFISTRISLLFCRS